MTQPMPLFDETWYYDCLDMIDTYANRNAAFTADDIRAAMRPAPQPNDVGTAFMVAHKRGLITTVGYTESTAPSRRGGLVRVWAKPKEDTL